MSSDESKLFYSLGSRCNIKMGVTEIRWGGMDWNHLAQDRYQQRTLVNMVKNLWVPQYVGKFSSSFSKRTELHGVS
jgi:hypothetical protein